MEEGERVVLLDSLPVRAQGKPRRSHGKMGFVEMARTIGHRWKTISQSTKAYYDRLARLERDRYKRDMARYNEEKQHSQIDSAGPTSPPLIASPTSVNSSSADWEPIYYEPTDIEVMNMYFDKDMIDILEKCSW